MRWTVSVTSTCVLLSYYGVPGAPAQLCDNLKGQAERPPADRLRQHCCGFFLWPPLPWRNSCFCWTEPVSFRDLLSLRPNQPQAHRPQPLLQRCTPLVRVKVYQTEAAHYVCVLGGCFQTAEVVLSNCSRSQSAFKEHSTSLALHRALLTLTRPILTDTIKIQNKWEKKNETIKYGFILVTGPWEG